MTLADDCLTFLEQYGDKLLHMLVAEEFSPQSVCQQLTLCQSQPVLGMGRIVGSHLRYRRSTPPAVGQHPESCKVCRAKKNSPDAPICAIAVNDIEGFTFDHCSAFDCSSEQCEPSQSPLIGSQKCTRGPAYFCGSQINAHECGGQSLVDMCTERRMGFGEVHPESCSVCRAMKESPNAPICEIAVRDVRGFTMEHCFALNCSAANCEPTEPKPPGADKCTRGPAYWCGSELQAHECGGQTMVDNCIETKDGFGATQVLEHPESCKVCRAMEKSPDAPICEIAVQDIEGFTMEQCAALDCSGDKCKPKKTLQSGPPRVGQNPCTWGPAYWCDLQINAHECGGSSTVGFCNEKSLGFGAV